MSNIKFILEVFKMKEKRKFVLRVQEIVRDSSGVVCGFKNERRIEFEVEDYGDNGFYIV